MPNRFFARAVTLTVTGILAVSCFVATPASAAPISTPSSGPLIGTNTTIAKTAVAQCPKGFKRNTDNFTADSSFKSVTGHITFIQTWSGTWCSNPKAKKASDRVKALKLTFKGTLRVPLMSSTSIQRKAVVGTKVLKSGSRVQTDLIVWSSKIPTPWGPMNGFSGSSQYKIGASPKGYLVNEHDQKLPAQVRVR